MALPRSPASAPSSAARNQCSCGSGSWARDSSCGRRRARPPSKGQGDSAFDDEGKILWAAHGVRTCRAAHAHVADAWHVPVRSLHLVDPRFYHLDTCFVPLHGGFLLYYPEAFDAASRAEIEKFYPAERRIAVSEADATRMACCALNIGRTVFTGEVSRELATRLFDLNFDVVQLELSEFIKGGGGAGALALRLSDLPVTHGVVRVDYGRPESSNGLSKEGSPASRMRERGPFFLLWLSFLAFARPSRRLSGSASQVRRRAGR